MKTTTAILWGEAAATRPRNHQLKILLQSNTEGHVPFLFRSKMNAFALRLNKHVAFLLHNIWKIRNPARAAARGWLNEPICTRIISSVICIDISLSNMVLGAD